MMSGLIGFCVLMLAALSDEPASREDRECDRNEWPAYAKPADFGDVALAGIDAPTDADTFGEAVLPSVGNRTTDKRLRVIPPVGNAVVDGEDEFLHDDASVDAADDEPAVMGRFPDFVDNTMRSEPHGERAEHADKTDETAKGEEISADAFLSERFSRVLRHRS